MSIPRDIHARAPIDATAARVTSRGEVYVPAKKVQCVCSETPLPTTSRPLTSEDLTGRKRGRLTVLGAGAGRERALGVPVRVWLLRHANRKGDQERGEPPRRLRVLPTCPVLATTVHIYCDGTEQRLTAEFGVFMLTTLPSQQTEAEGFVEFWQRYPNRTARKAALKAWNKLRPNAQLRALMFAAIEDQKAWRAQPGWHPEWPHGSTWINQERWTDELPGFRGRMEAWCQHDPPCDHSQQHTWRLLEDAKANRASAETASGPTTDGRR